MHFKIVDFRVINVSSESENNNSQQYRKLQSKQISLWNSNPTSYSTLYFNPLKPSGNYM
jgi:hypothetical protein